MHALTLLFMYGVPRQEASFVSDVYAECYPGYHDFANGVVDSDEEDFTHMDSKEGKSRQDFQTEEQWEVRLSVLCTNFSTVRARLLCSNILPKQGTAVATCACICAC